MFMLLAELCVFMSEIFTELSLLMYSSKQSNTSEFLI